ncbi:deoxyribodipyrimidine photolyase [Xenococcus sp. PCC 7305]|uniref:FAD-binding domain-containing protein n=1 Tax=Xenococcus sp. PCC 7305 TaxID=102125 RepID=UPI0002AC80FB|nr:FAD-binding domain-containing protein [Xenococcus sp. PCC 7305]ELS01406.1 deoxyribodipyrimidine photolyase [Xenococcus sp. PCC 7305]
MSDLILFWHRRDLRLTDNLGLAAAKEQTVKVVGVFCLDRDILTRDDIAPARVKYMMGCLQELSQSYGQIGSQLLITQGTPSQVIPQLASTLSAKAVYWNLDVEPYARKRDREVTIALQDKDITVQNFWDQLLHPPGAVLTQSEQPYKVYTPFWRNWSLQDKPTISPQIKNLQGLTATELATVDQIYVSELPTAEDLGYSWETPLLLAPGETAAQARLEEFSHSAIYQYDEQRNFPFNQGTSLLSAALKFGVISLRAIWQTTVEALENCRSEEARVNVITWQKELAWREFYQHCLYFFPELEQGPYRPAFKNFPWDNNPEHFQAWCQGKTGYPIVDAAMRQLQSTGWMHNRCRMIVASFLTKDLIIDWRWGEKYFMQTLFDGDLASNNGGWQWSASSGMDPKPLRIFNPASQAQKFDSEAEYIRQWLPEISSIDTEYLVTGKIPELERYRCNYPQQIVDHKIQQRKFKALYAQCK